jgi:hypothetical protein
MRLMKKHNDLMKRTLSAAILLLLVSFSSFSQETDRTGGQLLDRLFKRILSTQDDNERMRLNDSVKLIVSQYVSSHSFSEMKIEGVKNLGQIVSPDNRVRILTWNLALRNSPGKYFCYLIRKGEQGAADQVNFLNTEYTRDPIRSDTVYTQADWYGALYYDIKPFHTDNRLCWVLLGVNLSDPLATRKIIEVLSYTPDNRLIFGRRWFDDGNTVAYRHVLEYSSSAVISLRFMPDSSIVFDHLVPLQPQPGDEKIYLAPDYSYDAFIYSDRLWNFNRNVDARNREH